jgi:hypothetical protein
MDLDPSRWWAGTLDVERLAVLIDGAARPAFATTTPDMEGPWT